MLKVYGFSRVNFIARGNTRDLRVLWALEEMQMPYEIVGLDHPAQELQSDAYRALNPFEQIPAIDDDGLVLTESAAILIYLAKKSKKLIPSDLAGEAQVVRWSFAAMNSVELPMMFLMFIDWHGQNPLREQVATWANRHLGALERWLEGREFVATSEFTVADILMAHVLGVVKDQKLFEPFPRVRAYREKCFAREAWQRTIDAYCERVTAA